MSPLTFLERIAVQYQDDNLFCVVKSLKSLSRKILDISLSDVDVADLNEEVEGFIIHSLRYCYEGKTINEVSNFVNESFGKFIWLIFL